MLMVPKGIQPLQFWFCRNPGLALPLIALQYHEVKLNVQFTAAATGVATMNNDAVYSVTITSYLILMKEEDSHKSVTNILLNNYNFQTITLTNNRYRLNFNHPVKNGQSELRFNHPVKELRWDYKNQ